MDVLIPASDLTKRFTCFTFLLFYKLVIPVKKKHLHLTTNSFHFSILHTVQVILWHYINYLNRFLKIYDYVITFDLSHYMTHKDT